MADDASVSTAPTPTGGIAIPMIQLTQTRVPLEDAGEAFTVPDASGRLPIVVLPDQPFRIKNELVIAGVIALVVGVVFQLELAVRGGLIGIAGVLIFLGVFQSFIVAVPEGARALLLKAGRYDRTVGAGRHVVPPWIIVSHVVTIREIPFDALTTGVPTQDDVRVDIDLLMTFTIGAPEKFVFAISAPDFDQVCLAAALEAIRDLVRSKRSDEILDVSTTDTDRLRTAIGKALAGYGVQIERAVITHVQPPVEFMASRESRRLAAVRRDEQTDKFALEERLLADREALERQRVAAQREQIELEAANESLRLQHMEDRLRAFPNASRQDMLDQRIAVARALAGNTRAMVQVGSGGDVADALILHTLTDEVVTPEGNAAPTNDRPKRPARATRPTS